MAKSIKNTNNIDWEALRKRMILSGVQIGYVQPTTTTTQDSYTVLLFHFN